MSDPSILSPHAAALAITFGGIQLLNGGMNPENASVHLRMPDGHVKNKKTALTPKVIQTNGISSYVVAEM